MVLTSGAPSVSSVTANTTNEVTENEPRSTFQRGTAFWLVFLALCIALFVSALDALIISTALPTIIYDLRGDEFVWVANAYTLASTAIMPWTGSLANIFGRKPMMLSALLIFFLGSGLAGGAKDMTMLIAARAVQGLGSGGILAMTEIIVSDLVPLKDRGPFFGIIGSVWAIASAVGPPLGGVFSQDVSWRWIFYINLPLTGIAILLVVFFLNLRTPKDSLREKIGKIDWFGNFLIIGGCTAAIIGLSWAGVIHPWGSAQILVPLIIGLVTLGVSVWYEAKVPREPTIPFELFTNRTTVAGYATTAIHAIAFNIFLFYLPVYFQATKLASPIKSSVYTLGAALSIAPAAIATGASVTILKKYRPQNIIGWVLLIAGVGAWIDVHWNSGAGKYIGFQILGGIGIGILFPGTNFVVLAPLPPQLNAQALALFTFARQFFSTWGTTIGATILQNELQKRLPQAFLEQLAQNSHGSGAELSYAAIPVIPTIPDVTLQTEVRAAFADSLQIVWIVGAAIGGLGLLVSFFIKEIELHGDTDEKWGLEDKRASTAQSPGEKNLGMVESGTAMGSVASRSGFDRVEVADRVIVPTEKK